MPKTKTDLHFALAAPVAHYGVFYCLITEKSGDDDGDVEVFDANRSIGEKEKAISVAVTA